MAERERRPSPDQVRSTDIAGSQGGPHGDSLLDHRLRVVRDLLTPDGDPRADHGYGPVRGTPFVRGGGDATNGVGEDDPVQGDLGDCWLISAMIAVAHANPDAIRRLIRARGDGTYEVTLYVRGSLNPLSKVPKVLIVDGEFPMNGDKPAYAHDAQRGSSGQELWPMLLEKAVAQLLGSYGRLGGLALSRMGPIRGGGSKQGLEVLTAGNATTHATAHRPPRDILSELSVALREHRPIIAGTIDGEDGSSKMEVNQGRADATTPYGDPVRPRHDYAIVAADPGAGTVAVVDPLATPSGAMSGRHIVVDIADFQRLFVYYSIGAAL